MTNNESDIVTEALNRLGIKGAIDRSQVFHVINEILKKHNKNKGEQDA